MALTLAAWILLTWIGWALIFGSDSTAVIHGDTKEPAGLTALLYFSGFAVYTLGVGDYVPNGGLWQVLTPVAAINGFVLVTLSVTYVIQVIQAAVGDRVAARVIHALGDSPDQILQNAWNGRDFATLSEPLSQVAQTLLKHSQQHRAYPILFYFHESDNRSALPLRVAILGEALARVELLRPAEHGIDSLALGGAQAAINAVWESLPPEVKRKPPEPPSPPVIQALADQGLTWSPGENVTDRPRNLDERRRLLLALAMSDGWNWEEVAGIANR